MFRVLFHVIPGYGLLTANMWLLCPAAFPGRCFLPTWASLATIFQNPVIYMEIWGCRFSCRTLHVWYFVMQSDHSRSMMIVDDSRSVFHHLTSRVAASGLWCISPESCPMLIALDLLSRDCNSVFFFNFSIFFRFLGQQHLNTNSILVQTLENWNHSCL